MICGLCYCIACGSNDLFVFFESNDVELKKCKHCHMGRLFPKHEIGQGFFDGWGEEIFQESQKRLKMYKDRINRILKICKRKWSNCQDQIGSVAKSGVI